MCLSTALFRFNLLGVFLDWEVHVSALVQEVFFCPFIILELSPYECLFSRCPISLVDFLHSLVLFSLFVPLTG